MAMTNPTATPPGWYPHGGQQRYWDGAQWTDQTAPAVAVKTNGFAIAALVLGIAGAVLTPIPFFIGLFLGGLPDVLAIIFGIVAIAGKNKKGRPLAIVGLCLGAVAFLCIFVGSGTLW